MIKNISCKMTSYIKNNSDIKNHDDLEKISYSIELILGETFKLVVLIIIFSMLNKMNYFLFSMFILLSIRTFSGGYHSNSTLKCLLWTTIFFIMTSFIAPMIIELNTVVYLAISFFSVLVVFIKSPSPNKYRPIRSEKKRWHFKIISTSFVICWTIILLLFANNTSFLNCGFLTIFLQVLQMLFI